jgi:hypothetical protein
MAIDSRRACVACVIKWRRGNAAEGESALRCVTDRSNGLMMVVCRLKCARMLSMTSWYVSLCSVVHIESGGWYMLSKAEELAGLS